MWYHHKVNIVTFVLYVFVVKLDLVNRVDFSFIFSITLSIFYIMVPHISVVWYKDHHLRTGLMGHLLRWSKQFTEMQPTFVFISFTLASSVPQHKVSLFQDYDCFWLLARFKCPNNDVFALYGSLSIILHFQDQTPSWVNICGGTYLFSEDRKSWFTAWKR